MKGGDINEYSSKHKCKLGSQIGWHNILFGTIKMLIFPVWGNKEVWTCVLPHTNKVTADLSPLGWVATVLGDLMIFKCKISCGQAIPELSTSKKFKLYETLVLWHWTSGSHSSIPKCEKILKVNPSIASVYSQGKHPTCLFVYECALKTVCLLLLIPNGKQMWKVLQDSQKFSPDFVL